MKIKIKWLYDDYDCDQCGGASAEGALVTFEDGQKLHLKPVAHCFGGESWTECEVYESILNALGHSLEYAHGSK